MEGIKKMTDINLVNPTSNQILFNEITGSSLNDLTPDLIPSFTSRKRCCPNNQVQLVHLQYIMTLSSSAQLQFHRYSSNDPGRNICNQCWF